MTAALYGLNSKGSKDARIIEFVLFVDRYEVSLLYGEY